MPNDKTISSYKRFFLLMLVLFFLGGCGLGKDKILFLTKTSFGVDVDSKPPTLDIGYARTEGTIAPVLKDGQVLPQMASFDSEAGIINQAIGQSFATGNAAELLSKYLASAARPDTDAIEEDLLGKPKTIESQPEDQRRAYFFGTNTNFALRIGFPVEQGGIPDSLNLGYKRKEIAVVPLISIPYKDDDDKDKLKVALPSLLSTVSINSNAYNPSKSSTEITQFYATGLAANNLAALPEIRGPIGRRLIGEDADRAVRAVKFKLRGKNYTDKDRQARIKKITDDISKLSNEKAFDLMEKPPVALDEETLKLANQIDRNCKRLLSRDCNGDGKPDAGEPGSGKPEVAKRILKTIVIMNSNRSDQELDAWDASVSAVQ